MIQFALPDLTPRTLTFSLAMVRIKHSMPELFYDDVDISSIYGNFPGCIMNGGRTYSGKQYSRDRIEKVLDAVSNEGLITRLTFTNKLIRPEHFEDEYANIILAAAQKHHAQVIVHSDELADYISGRYHLELILSTTRALHGVEELNAMLDRYSMVVLDYNHNKDDAFLRRVSDPSRLEVMPNELCEPGCPNRQRHYDYLSRYQLDPTIKEAFTCPQKQETKGFSTRTESSPTLLSNQDIRRLYFTYGIRHYKIVGRNESWETITESFLYYLVRTEYRSLVLEIAKKEMEKMYII